MRESGLRNTKFATQMGNQEQHRRRPAPSRSVELVQAGAIGPVREVHVWTNRPGWPQAPTIVARPTETVAVPSYLHWDLFLGGAPERPYNPCYHPGKWRGWWDFGTGALGDMGCHTANMPFMALKLQYPTSVVAESGELNSETYPGWATIRWEFPARGDMPPVKFTWYEGKKVGSNGETTMNLPSPDLFKGEDVPRSGSLLVGDKGSLFAPGDGDNGTNFPFKLLPQSQFANYEGPAPTMPRNGKSDPGQKKEWIDAIKGGPPALSNFGYAGLLTETILLGNLAIRVGKKIEWDGPNMRLRDQHSRGGSIRDPAIPQRLGTADVGNEIPMFDACRRFARKYPIRTLLICGLLLNILPVGFAINVKMLVQNDLIPNQYWREFQTVMQFISILLGLMALTGYILIGMSALVAVRRLNNKAAETSSGVPKVTDLPS